MTAPDEPRSAQPDVPPGLLLVNKPSGVTSHDVVGRVRAILGTRRVGHAGTLDPMATGLLVVAVGRATKLLGHLALAHKSYSATIRLGAATTTDDAEGEIIARTDASGIGYDAVRAVMAAFTGSIDQVPSSVSAVKVDGRRAYARVRAGEEVRLAPRRVQVSRFEATAPARVPDGASGGALDVDVIVECSTGTYVRALAGDLGAALGVGGHLTALRRRVVGPFDVADAVDIYPDGVPVRGEGRRPLPEGLAAVVRQAMLPVSVAARRAFPAREVDAAQAADLRHGRPLPAAGVDGTYAVFDADGELLALVTETGTSARPVFVWQAAG